MPDPVRLVLDGPVAVVTIDNPPVNATSHAVRAGLAAALDAAEAAGVSRIVLTGAGRTFVAGADAREFNLPPMPPILTDLVSRIERSPVPVVAAINGAALGGGLELAFACRLRIAAPSAVVGLPEVSLGVVPGAGGTQRLPRLIGLGPALDLISEGRTLKAAEALALGLVDAVTADPVDFARTAPLPDRPVTGDLPAPSPDADAVTAARAKATRRTPRQIAPQEAISLVEAATRLPLAEGLALERDVFLTLRASEQGAALRHLFFAERAAQARTRQPGGPDVASVVVVGGGTMGAAITYALLGIGVAVTLVETDDAAVERARANVGKLYGEAIARGKTTAEKAAADQAARLSFRAGYQDLPPVDIAIEAVFEDLDVKRQVFAALDAALPETTILATNTSYLDVNRIAEVVRAPGRFLGLHFFAPAHLMKLVEAIRGRDTTPETFTATLRLAGRLGKIPVPARVCDGFIGNRILTRYRQTCDVMLLEGALPSEVDAALRGFGMAMGPYEVQDLSGLDIAYANRKRQNWKARTDIRYVPIADRIVEETGRLGRKTGAGWYDYADGRGTPSALIDALVVEESARAGITRRPFNADEIVLRATGAMIAEGLAILAEGIADTAADIDLVLVHGYGFPRWRGGPMQYATFLGLPVVLTRLEELAAADPVSFAVPPLLARLVADGRGLDSL
ncbi:3-hydroxyacyl-CoA dehydrogenase NAD-binding domain-containing protein [Segnochrobactraceae bacterium EtOH-i3]